MIKRLFIDQRLNGEMRIVYFVEGYDVGMVDSLVVFHD